MAESQPTLGAPAPQSAQVSRRGGFKHGLSRLPEYRAWQTMRLRCLNPDNRAYPDYGGRGIKVCERWKDDFLAFYADMGPKPTAAHELDREDNEGNYEPGNCRWVTRSVNDRNRRNNHWLEYRGERRLLIELCEQFGIRQDTLRFRLKIGMTVEEALTRPVKPRRPNGAKAADRANFVDQRFRFSDEQRRSAIALYAEGHGPVHISRMTGLSRGYVKKLVKRAGIRRSAK